MKPTIEYIERKFDEFNLKIFGGRLPRIPIQLSDAGSFLGKCVYRQSRLPDGLRHYSEFKLRISNKIDLPENVIEDTIIHEMIHYLILWTGLQDSSQHGRIFKAIMSSINAAHGRNITISYKTSHADTSQTVNTRHRLHVIAAIYFHSGKTGVKVLPRTVPKILAYCHAVSSHPEVAAVKLYLHDNPFFDRFPTSAALRLHEIDKSLLEDNLRSARTLKIKGTKIIEEA